MHIGSTQVCISYMRDSYRKCETISILRKVDTNISRYVVCHKFIGVSK